MEQLPMQAAETEDALEQAVTEAFDRILSRLPVGRRVEALRSLREELERCISEMPMSGAPADATGMRARFSALAAGFAPYEPAPAIQ